MSDAPSASPTPSPSSHPPAGAPALGTPGAPDPGAPAQALILVVERDPHVRDLEAYFLNEAGYQVRFAADGAAALELARRERPAIVITEVLVPKLDGLALCRALKADPTFGPVRVLVFSILAAAGRAREAGADAFLMKPLAERRLVETVRALVAQPSPALPPS